MAVANLQPVIDVTLNEQIRERIKHYIVVNHLQPGDKLPTEESLAQALAVSRPAVREALRSLESLGIVEARQGVGRVVCEFNFDTILDNLSYALAFHNASVLHITEIRKALDLYYMEAIVLNLSEEDLDHLAELVDGMRRHQAAGWGVEDEDRGFHRLLIERSGNPVAVQWFDVAWNAKNKAYALYGWRQFDDPCIAHRAILAALRRRDVAAAKQAVAAHYEELSEQMQQHVELASAQRAAGRASDHPSTV